ncbi:MAG TPA: type II secretion system protein [Candidatus Paceibacterota bacterium]|nr:type II secretion system protein [Candidatus Paceibacterota bacterium]
MIKKKHAQQGFTLVEMLVSVSLFVIVAFIVVTTFLTIAEAYRKSQAMRLVIDNINFAMDSITLRLRDGNGYVCGTPLDSSCGNGSGPGVTFNTTDRETMIYRWVRDNPERQYLAQCVVAFQGNLSACNDPGSYREVTSPDINLTNVQFTVFDSKVVLSLTGEAQVGKQASTFTLQTTIAERP